MTRNVPVQGSPAAAPARAPTPFWLRLNSFFGFPLQREPLIYALLLALLGLPMGLFIKLGMLPGLVLAMLGFLLAVSRYAFKVMALASQGLLRTQDYPRHDDQDWKPLPWKLFALLVLQGMLLGFVGRRSMALYMALNLAVSLALPAAVMVLVQSMSLRQALNPFLQLATMQAVGWPYLLLCAFLFLLSMGAPMVLGVLLPAVGAWLGLPVVLLVLSYFAWVMAALMGYVMYQSHEALGIELAPGGGDSVLDAPSNLPPEKLAERQDDALVGQRLAAGDVAGALALAAQRVQAQPESLAAHRRYHKALLQSNDAATLATHGERMIGQLLARGERGEALRVWMACHARAPGFALSEASQTLALAQAAWAGADAEGALALLKGYDRRYRGDPRIADAYELIVRVLVQGLGRAGAAQPVLQALQQRFRDSAQAQQATWVMQQFLNASARSKMPAAGASKPPAAMNK